VFTTMTIWGGIKECKDNIWHGDVRSRPQEVNEQFDTGIMYNGLDTMITVYFNALYQHSWPDLKSPWGDSCRAPVHIAPQCSPSEGCPNTCDCFAPANNKIQYNTGHLLQVDMNTTPNKRTCPNNWTFSVGMNMPGCTFCRYHLKGLQFSLFLKLWRSVRSPMSRSW
jgi:hypothetical protein